MRKLSLAACAVLCLTLSALAQDVNAPIQQMMKAFNTNDTKLLASLYAAGNITIVDEVPPYVWTGTNANESWLADLEKHDKAAGVTGETATARPATRADIVGDTAYVVVPTTYSYKEKNTPMVQEAHMVFVLHKEGGAWKIASWTWAGSRSKPAK